MDGNEKNYVLYLSQAPIDSNFYLNLPAGFHVDGEDENETYFLKLKKNPFGICQEAKNWFVMFKTGLEDE